MGLAERGHPEQRAEGVAHRVHGSPRVPGRTSAPQAGCDVAALSVRPRAMRPALVLHLVLALALSTPGASMDAPDSASLRVASPIPSPNPVPVAVGPTL